MTDSVDPRSSILGSYLPRCQLRRLAAVRSDGDRSTVERGPAVFLIVDVSGFTALTDHLARQGHEGAERLSRILNECFGRMIGAVTAHGGDILCFAGDAALVVWPAEGERGLADAVSRAGSAALSIQEELAGYEAAPGAVLRLRASIGVGTVTQMELGGFQDRWEFVVAGDAILDATGADRVARPGDVVLSPDAWRLVSGRCHGEVLESGFCRLLGVGGATEPPDLAPEHSMRDLPATLRRQLPRIVVERLDAGLEEWVAEFRSVSVSFIRFLEGDIGRKGAHGSAQEAVHRMQRILTRHEGSLYQLLMDDHGTYVVAVFGLPPLAHPDDPARAVRAVLTIRDQLLSLGITTGAGITTGVAFCGVYGTDARRQYSIVGDVVNRSSRLMTAAGDGLLCDEATASAVEGGGEFEVTPLGAIPLKGKPGRVPVFALAAGAMGPRRPVGKRAAETQVVGRVVELGVLTGCLTALQSSGEGGVVVVEGEPGMGKSRLVEELLLQADRLGVRWLSGAGDEVDRSSPYHAWRPIFHALVLGASAHGGVTEESVREWLATVLPEHHGLRERYPLLSIVLPTGVAETELTSALAPEARAENTRALLCEILDRATPGTRLVLVLDDAEALDSASWALAALVARSLPHVLLVLALQPMKVEPPELQGLLRAAGSRVLRLAPLGFTETRELVCGLLQISHVPDPVVALVHERGGGSPLVTRELAFALRDSGILTLREGHGTLASPSVRPDSALDEYLNVHGVSGTLQSAVMSRVDRLPQQVQLTLKVASVLGHAFGVEPLGAVRPGAVAPEELAEQIEVLVRQGLLRTGRGDPRSSHMFSHAITREVVYGSIPFAQRAALHRAVAEHLGRRVGVGEGSGHDTVRLAHHWRRAGELSRALRHTVEAADAARANHANMEAVRFFSEALELEASLRRGAAASADAGGPFSSTPSARALWERRLGEAYANWARYDEARVHLERGLRHGRQVVPRTTAGAFLALSGQVGRQVLHRLRPGRYLASRTDRAESLTELVRAYEALMEAYYVTGKTVPCIHAALRCLNLAELAGPSAELARAYASTGAIVGFTGARGLADAYGARALDTAERSGDTSARAWVRLARGTYLAGEGRWAEAEKLLEGGAALSASVGDRRRREDCLGNLTDIAHFQGRFARSLELADELFASATGGGGVDAGAASARGERRRHRQWAALRARVYSLLALGDVGGARAGLGQLEPLVARDEFAAQGDTAPLRDSLLSLHAMEALAYLRGGGDARAAQEAEEASRIAAGRFVAGWNFVLEYAATAEVLLRVREAETLRSGGGSRAARGRDKAGRRACRSLKRVSRYFPVGRPHAVLWEGLRLWLDGRPGEAARRWEESIAAARGLAMPYVEAQAHLELARHLPPEDGRRAEHLASAREIFQRLGARWDLARAALEGA